MKIKRINKEKRLQVYAKYDGRCAYCGEHILYGKMQVDHIVAKQRVRFKGISEERVNGLSNLNPSCSTCNYYKGAKSLKGFKKLLETLHKRLKKVFIVRIAIKYGILKLGEFDGLFYFEKKQKDKSL